MFRGIHKGHIVEESAPLSSTLDNINTAVQGLSSKGCLPKDIKLVNEILTLAGITYKVDENLSQEELNTLMGLGNQ